MWRSREQLQDDVLGIWRAGVAAVDSRRLVMSHLRVEGESFEFGDESISLRECRRIVVVGCGKAGAGMADGVEQALGARWLAEKDVTGWVNVPQDCVRKLQRIHLHAARPAGHNEPTAAGVEGATRILELVESLTPRDICLCLISGGGSALLPAPIPGITLADKQSITKHLSAAGANIRELNTVRKQLSRIKGGKLARACRAGRLITLIISDVLGDPLDVIGSGPTVDDTATPGDALEVLDRFGARQAGISPAVFRVLERAAETAAVPPAATAALTNLVIGNNATAVDAAGAEAVRRGYSPALLSAQQLEGPAEDVGRHHARLALRMLCEPGPDCLITGGEPTVKLVEATRRGLGGRNQQLVLAAWLELCDTPPANSPSMDRGESPADDMNPFDGLALLAGGTDGEDGPTDAAGAWLDADQYAVWQASRPRPDANDYLHRNDAYRFFEPLGGLLKTGPTHTNVCDVRVAVVARGEARG
jgi:hydroxypyruvate reductase